MLSQRILGAAVIAAIMVLPLYFGGWIFAGLVIVLVAGAIYELGKLTRLPVGSAIPLLGVVCGCLLVVDAQLRASLVVPIFLLGALVALTMVLFGGQTPETSARSWAATLLGPLYLGLPLSFLVSLRNLDDGLVWVLVALFGTWAADIGAYFVGRSLGRHKLYPRISPAKSWEGLVGGTAAAALVLALFMHFAGGAFVDVSVGRGIPLWLHGAVLGIVVSCVALVGDLGESLLKRASGVKDAGSLIPGHGGILDRVDSLVFTVPFVYYYLVVVVMG